ncbi:MAG: neutral/alkaline non-lysosomal ceramidase N-terminal domain-containing protein [Psychrobacter sp.]|nr:neutral/alkaline non-lysosomal ceramidase N-terminal domain-containing protein [Psychrobacter sp.]
MTIKNNVNNSSVNNNSQISPEQTPTKQDPLDQSLYLVGWGKAEIKLTPKGYAMFGYGMWHHRATGQRTPLYARCFYMTDDNQNSLIFVCCDLGYISRAIREGVEARIEPLMDEDYHRERLVLTATHTHSGPGGCSHEGLYNLVTPGFVPEHLESIITAITTAITTAKNNRKPTQINLSQGAIDDEVEVAWNRSVDSYNQNPEITTPYSHTQTHLALDRTMSVLGFEREGQLVSLLSLFGVHATCLGNTLPNYDGDNKGYAAQLAETQLAKTQLAADSSGLSHPNQLNQPTQLDNQLDNTPNFDEPIAIFAQGTAGDISPHYHGPGDVARRAQIKGEAEYEYARNNGRLQSEHALKLASLHQDIANQNLANPHLINQDTVHQPLAISGGIDGVLTYIDFTQQKADPQYAQGCNEAYTSEPCHGVSFFTGTRVDGPGIPRPLGLAVTAIAKSLKRFRLTAPTVINPDKAYYQSLYQAQGHKDIMMESGTRKRTLTTSIHKILLPDISDPTVASLKQQASSGALTDSPLVATVLPLQIVKLGQIAIVCCPGEFTTIAGQRIQAMLQDKFAASGINQVIICTYCNDYMGYVTTQEEYQMQAYEGGHTVFGQWTQAAFQTQFDKLGDQLLCPADERSHDTTTLPKRVPADELIKRSNLPIPRHS